MTTRPLGSSDVLLVTDLQNDFFPGGALAVPHADEVMAPLNKMIAKFAHVVLTQDWHPPTHISFASAHEGRQPFDKIAVSYGEQTLWPDHCIQGTHGADFRQDLSASNAELILRKGYHLDIDSYSAFHENDRQTPTGLTGYLRERGFGRIFIAGLALDFCIRFSAEDAHSEGFSAIVVEDACRAIATGASLSDTRQSFLDRGIPCVSSETLA